MIRVHRAEPTEENIRDMEGAVEETLARLFRDAKEYVVVGRRTYTLAAYERKFGKLKKLSRKN